MSISNILHSNGPNNHHLRCDEMTCNNMNIGTSTVNSLTVGDNTNTDQTLINFKKGLNASDYHLRYENTIWGVPDLNGLVYDMNATGPSPQPQSNLLLIGTERSVLASASEDLVNGTAFIGAGLLSSSTLTGAKKCAMYVDGATSTLSWTYGYDVNPDLPLSTFQLNGTQSKANSYTVATANVLGDVNFSNLGNINANALIKNATDPVDPQDVATKNYVDTQADNSIYTSDGTLTGNRVVTMGANSLTFSGSSTIQLNAAGNTNIASGALTFNATGKIRQEGGSGEHLTICNVNPTVGSLLVQRVGGFGVNNNAITLTNDVSGFAKVSLNNVQNFVDASPSHFLSVNPTTGDVSQSPVSAVTNIYNSDGTLSSNRVINCDNKVLSITNANTMTLSSASQTVYIGSSSGNIQTDALGLKYNTSGSFEHVFNNNINISSNKLLSVADGTLATDGINKGQLDTAISGVQTIYNSDSSLNGNRSVNQGAFNIDFNGTGTFNLNSTGNFTVDGSTILNNVENVIKSNSITNTNLSIGDATLGEIPLNLGKGSSVLTPYNTILPEVQQSLSFLGSGGQYRHTITTCHNAGGTIRNSIELNIWQPSDGPNNLPSTPFYTFEGDFMGLNKYTTGNKLESTGPFGASTQLLATDAQGRVCQVPKYDTFYNNNGTVIGVSGARSIDFNNNNYLMNNVNSWQVATNAITITSSGSGSVSCSGGFIVDSLLSINNNRIINLANPTADDNGMNLGYWRTNNHYLFNAYSFGSTVYALSFVPTPLNNISTVTINDGWIQNQNSQAQYQINNNISFKVEVHCTFENQNMVTGSELSLYIEKNGGTTGQVKSDIPANGTISMSVSYIDTYSLNDIVRFSASASPNISVAVTGLVYNIVQC